MTIVHARDIGQNYPWAIKGNFADRKGHILVMAIIIFAALALVFQACYKRWRRLKADETEDKDFLDQEQIDNSLNFDHNFRETQDVHELHCLDGKTLEKKPLKIEAEASQEAECLPKDYLVYKTKPTASIRDMALIQKKKADQLAKQIQAQQEPEATDLAEQIKEEEAEEEEKTARKAYEASPENPAAAHRYGKALNALRKYKEAEKILEKICHAEALKDPAIIDSNIFLDYFNALKAQSKFIEAIQVCETGFGANLINLGPIRWRYKYLIKEYIRNLSLENNYAEAEEQCKKLMNEHTTYLDFYIYAEVLQKQGKYEEAAIQFKLCLTQIKKKRRLALASAKKETYLRLGYQKATYRMKYAENFQLQGNNEKAMKQFEKALFIYSSKGDYKKSFILLEKIFNNLISLRFRYDEKIVRFRRCFAATEAAAEKSKSNLFTMSIDDRRSCMLMMKQLGDTLGSKHQLEKISQMGEKGKDIANLFDDTFRA